VSPTGERRARPRALAEHVPDLLPLLALIAAGLARALPSHTLAARVDVLLAILVLVTALDIDPRELLAVRARWRTVLLLSSLPLLALAACGWGLAQAVHGTTRDGVLALGLSPTEVASVGLIGLMGGAAELGIAVLAGSLVLSAVIGPPLLVALGNAAHATSVAALLGRFALVVLLPLLVGLLVRAARPQLARAKLELSTASSLAVVLLVYASLSDTHGGGLASAALISAAFLAVSALLAVAVMRTLGHHFDRTLALTIGMRDFAVAAALATGAFGAAAGHVAGVYGVLMLLIGASVTGVVRRKRARGSRLARQRA
jgi:BASS family bile acid:Na+ symporter